MQANDGGLARGMDNNADGPNAPGGGLPPSSAPMARGGKAGLGAGATLRRGAEGAALRTPSRRRP